MFPPAGTKVVQLDIDPHELGRNYPNTVSIMGDAQVTLRRMIEAAKPRPADAAVQWVKRAQQFVAELALVLDAAQDIGFIDHRQRERPCGD